MSKVLSFKKSEKEINFKVFGRSVAEGNLEQAARTLRDMLNCDLEKANELTKFFHDQFKKSPNIIMKTMSIKSFIEEEQHNDALLSIQEVFGATGADSLMILEAMKRQFKAT